MSDQNLMMSPRAREWLVGRQNQIQLQEVKDNEHIRSTKQAKKNRRSDTEGDRHGLLAHASARLVGLGNQQSLQVIGGRCARGLRQLPTVTGRVLEESDS